MPASPGQPVCVHDLPVGYEPGRELTADGAADAPAIGLDRGEIATVDVEADIAAKSFP